MARRLIEGGRRSQNGRTSGKCRHEIQIEQGGKRRNCTIASLTPIVCDPNCLEQVQSFMDALVSWGTEYKSASLWGFRNKQSNWTKHMRSTGFKTEFKDTDAGSSDQIRHSIGGVMAGYVGAVAGTDAVSVFMNDVRESDWWGEASEESHKADIALNNMTIPRGAMLAGVDGIQNAIGLGDWISTNLCSKGVQDGAGSIKGGVR